MSIHYIPLTGYNQTCSTVQSCSPNLLVGLDTLPEEVTFSLGFVATGGVSELVVFASSVELVSELHPSVFLSSDDTFALLNQAHAWFLEIVFVKMSVCVCVCVSAPQAIKNYSREMKPE